MNISLFKKAALLCVLFFMGISNALAISSTIERSSLKNNFNKKSHSVSWNEEHVSFTLSGDNLYTTFDYLYICNEDVWLIGNRAASYTLSWSVVSGYDIVVTKVILNIERASGGGAYISIEGKKWGDLFWSENIPTGGIYSENGLHKENEENISIVFSKATTWSTCAINSIEIIYTLRPRMSAENGVVDLTTSEDNKKLIDLTTLSKPVDSHVTSYSYSVIGVSGEGASISDAHITDDKKFYATAVGVYTLRDTTGYAICHNSNYVDFTVTVKRAQYVFDGSGSEADDPNHITWCYDDNWNENLKPGIEDEVLIEHNVVIRQEVSAYSVTIEEGYTLTIMPTGGLTVGAGGIIDANKDNLILKAGTEGDSKGKTGYLRISPEYTGAMPEATVELYTIGYYNMNVGNHQDVGTWQYVGSPMVNDGTLARNVFTKNMLYDWNEATGEWKNNLRRLVLQPFTGYATSQYNEEGRLVTNQGQLVDNGVVVLPLTYTESSATPGCNVFANSFTAPIDISKLETSDFSEGVDATIHLFNTGSKMDVAALSEKKSVESIDVNAAGQYLSIPVINAKTLNSEFGYPILIPAMQGFYVNTDKAGTLTLDYEKLVWKTNLVTTPNTALRAPKRSADEEEQIISGALQVTLATDGMTDNLFLLEAEHYDASFENGLDARKKMSCAFNIFAIEDSAQLAVDATNSIIGTLVGVRTGDETAYTLVFSHLKTENALALLDNETEETIDINEGSEYTFFAEPNSVITERFRIVESANAPAIATGTENAKSGVKAQKFIKDGQLYVLKNGVLYNAMGAVVR